MEIPSLNKINELNGISHFPLLGIIYGSKKENSDLDVFLLYDFYVEKNVFNLGYDLNQIDKNNFLHKIYCRDIEYTEPILTGDYFTGNKDIFLESKNFLLNEIPKKEIFDYLKKRTIETFLQAENYYSFGKIDLFNQLAVNNQSSEKIKSLFFENGFFDSEILNKSLSLLTYTYSYLASILRYKEGYNFVTIENIMKNPINEIEINFCNLRRYFKDCIKKKQSLSFKEIDSYFEIAQNLIRRKI